MLHGLISWVIVNLHSYSIYVKNYVRLIDEKHIRQLSIPWFHKHTISQSKHTFLTKLVCISVAIHFQIYFNRPQKLYASVQQSLNLLDRLLQDEVCACHYDLNITNHRIVLVAHMMDIWNSPMVGKLSLPHVNGFCILTFNLQRKKNLFFASLVYWLYVEFCYFIFFVISDMPSVHVFLVSLLVSGTDILLF